MSEQTQSAPAAQPGIAGVKNIIAIASGKGGVGKSTVSTNLAYALKHLGATVGLMDADIYGPSQPGMLGSGDDKPVIGETYLEPVVRYGISFVSMGLLIPDDGPVVWRGPMATKMIQQFIGSVLWGDLDYLLIDLPPGTGDVQLTLAQQASLTGAVIVTTPQEVALGVARKGIKMFEQVKVPIIGVVENMSGFVCSHCGKETAIFKEGGGAKLAEEFSVPLLGSLPLDPAIMMSGDDGQPVLAGSSDSPAATAIMNLAVNVRASLDKMAGNAPEDEPTDIALNDKGELTVAWGDGSSTRHTPYHLRLQCQCAQCVDEDTGTEVLDKKKIPLDITIKEYNRVGRYGLSIGFSDGHSTGIYVYKRLRTLNEEGTAQESFDV